MALISGKSGVALLGRGTARCSAQLKCVLGIPLSIRPGGLITNKPTRVKHLSGASTLGGLMALPKNIRIKWKGLLGQTLQLFTKKVVNLGRKEFDNIGTRFGRDKR